MRIRYPVALAVVAIAFVGLAVVAGQAVIAGYDTLFNAWPTSEVTQSEADVIQARQNAAQAVITTFQPLIGWSIVGACIAATGTAALVVLRARAQRASASSTASRDAS